MHLNHVLRSLALMVLLSGVGKVLAQWRVSVVDASTSTAVPYAHVLVQASDGSTTSVHITGPDGWVDLPVLPSAKAPGARIRVSYMGYITLQAPLDAPGEKVVKLVRSNVGLNEVVVTGQYAPGSPERAVHKVRVLDAERIRLMAANTLGDALRNELNIRLAQDNILGTSISMQGLGGENVKVLIDGIPVVGRQDGNIDLGQIDLTGVERIEVVEGPLSVNYGTNALAGTINLITRKGTTDTTTTLRGSVYTEHIGRLNTTLSASGSWGRDRLTLSAGRNFFAGWDPARPGLPDLSPHLADSTRYQQWKPREQFFGRLNYQRMFGVWTLGYKGEVMHDRIVSRGMPRAPYYETAFDEQFLTVRLDNAVFLEGRLWERYRVNVLGAYNTYERRRNTWFRDLTTLDEQLAPLEGTQDTSRFSLLNLRGTFAQPQGDRRIGYEVGFDSNAETGAGERISEGRRSIADHAIFGSMEVAAHDRVTVRPGLRYAYNTRYEAPLIPSVNVRWRLSPTITLRSSYARGFRAPSLKELHFLFVDINHDIVGNPSLKAESAHHGSMAISYRHVKDRTVYTSEFNAAYNAVDDLISLAQLQGTRFTYVNVGRFRSALGSAGAGWDNGHWVVSVGASVTGRYDTLASSLGEPWIVTPEVRGSLTRRWMAKGWTASLFWKYQGELANYAVVDAVTVQRQFIAPYHLADMTITKRIWKDRIALSAGCKDLFNVRNLQATLAEGVHANGDGALPMTTGRTAFVRVELEIDRQARYANK
ncbi:MAG: TonB-dependent receptor [Flavobacteriales bacterium]|nr:TonB-dependent receptor [Flavobacteriales bacterium]